MRKNNFKKTEWVIVITLSLVILFFTSCNYNTKLNASLVDSVKNTIKTVSIVDSTDGLNDKNGNLTLLQGIKIGDTVIVETLDAGDQTGILRAEYQGHYWIQFFSYPVREWRTSYPGIFPYTKKWEKLLHPYKN